MPGAVVAGLALILAGILAQASADAPPPAPAPTVAVAPAADDQPDKAPPDAGIIAGRRKPGYNEALPPPLVLPTNQGAVAAPPPQAFPGDTLPLPDRWRIMSSLCPAKGGDQTILEAFAGEREVCHGQSDPYHQNPLKGDIPLDPAKVPWLPIHGDDWFFEGNFTSDSVVEARSLPLPVSNAAGQNGHDLSTFGGDRSIALSQTFLVSASLIKGSTTFKPPEIEYHISLGFNVNYAQVSERQILNVDAARAPHRFDTDVALQEAYIDYHLRNTSARYDFDSIRVGIQPFQADFRGFLFNDEQLGIRLFGDRDDNRLQYNLAVFWRLEKNINSGLNDVTQAPRHDQVFLANVYRQDFLIPGFTSQLTFVYNRNREANEYYYDQNGFPERPALIGNLRGHDYDAFYLGYNADGHIHRMNLTASAYYLFGHDSVSQFTGQAADISAYFLAAEASYDHDWMRLRVSGLYSSGQSNVYSKTETGFDAIYENPIFAGADTSYWIRQSIPFIAGGRAIALNQPNGILNDLRTSKDLGQSNFVNPGTVLTGVGADFDLLPTLRLATNANHLWFAETGVLETLRQQGNIARDIGWDLSSAVTWRPKATQNIILRLSAALLVAGQGMRDLFGNSSGDSNYYSILGNVIFNF
ncbi:MAG: hypothetical protein KGK11_10985 [Sphingomonadales bacterium]|nr:hypothetical protein [Sphingomonadales bacterium]